MGNLRIEASEHWVEYGAAQSASLDPKWVKIKIMDDEEVVAETNLETLITKFLVVSAEYAKAMSLLGLIQEQQKAKSRVVIAGQEEVKQVVAEQMNDFYKRQDS